jgi:hypothetical protein
MPDNNQSERELYQTALQRTKDCPSIEEIERVLDGKDSQFAAHIEFCSFCAAELDVLKTFCVAEVLPEDEHAVQLIAGRLRDVKAVIPDRPSTGRDSWWRSLFGNLFGGSWVVSASLATAAFLMLIAIGLQLRRGAPSIDGGNGSGSEVQRSQGLAILAPKGDVQSAPVEVRWEAVPSAATYEVRLLEVDHHELWSARTAQISLPLPADARARMLPAKTLLFEVTAFDSAGRKVAGSEFVRFRVLQ